MTTATDTADFPTPAPDPTGLDSTTSSDDPSSADIALGDPDDSSTYIPDPSTTALDPASTPVIDNDNDNGTQKSNKTMDAPYFVTYDIDNDPASQGPPPVEKLTGFNVVRRMPRRGSNCSSPSAGRLSIPTRMGSTRRILHRRSQISCPSFSRF
ncbi:hypothetical protein MVEN_01151200 [Mycena venus]|uniref:Uncharacterized protein n=1 Tax=Mycena venus TaxID=2733690 RepID=A0A8H7CVJ6_9AGAR|nr:hypothetical protein MVEN_01151200 [Mycena venus]